jgi:hypothetical protein
MPEQRSSQHNAIAPASIVAAIIDAAKDPLGVLVVLDARAKIVTPYGKPVEYWVGLELAVSKN